MSVVNPHLKVLGTSSAPLTFAGITLEQRLDRLAARLAALDDGIAALAAQKKVLAASTAPSVSGGACSPTVGGGGGAAVAQWAPCAQDTAAVAKLRTRCQDHQLRTCVFQWVPSDYYQRPLSWRRDLLQAPSMTHLCKAILMENTHHKPTQAGSPASPHPVPTADPAFLATAPGEFAPDAVLAPYAHLTSVKTNSRYYLVVFPYTERFDSEKLRRVIQEFNPGMGKKNFNFRMCADGAALAGFEPNAIPPFGCRVPTIPVVLADVVTKLLPAYFWMGAGHVDCKLRLDTHEFITAMDPIVADVTVPLTEDEMKTVN